MTYPYNLQVLLYKWQEERNSLLCVKEGLDNSLRPGNSMYAPIKQQLEAKIAEVNRRISEVETAWAADHKYAMSRHE